MKKFLRALASPIFMSFLLVLLIVTLATATFIENDFGAAMASYKVYDTLWFETILVLLALNLLIRIFTLKLYRTTKFSVFLFHIAFIFMLIGSGITRYFGEEGTMHIREGRSSNIVSTNEKVLTASFYNKKGDTVKYEFDSNIELKQALNKTAHFDGQTFDIKLKKYYQAAQPVVENTPNGIETIGFIISGNSMHGLWYLTSGETKSFNNTTIGFNNNNADIRFSSHHDSLFLSSNSPVTISSMRSKIDAPFTTNTALFEKGKLYNTSNMNLVFRDYHKSAQIIPSPLGINKQTSASKAMIFEVSSNNKKKLITLWENSWSKPIRREVNDITIELSYGKKQIALPFTLYLNNFVIERYPGSQSPSSYSSYVTLVETGKDSIPEHIYMNNILKYKGYRFFQSSYDNDEQGTILSVNHDPAGTAVTYIGYFLMALGMAWSLINKNTFFRRTGKTSKTLAIATLLGLQIIATQATAQSSSEANTYQIVDKQHAERFGELLIQNNRGRTEPVHSFASELLRKISRKDKIKGCTPEQLFIEMNSNPDYWSTQAIIRVSNNELQKTLGLTGKYAAYSDFFSQNRYVMQGLVQMAHAKPVSAQTKYDKAIIKTDEKINICYGIFTGDYLRIFPAPGSNDSTVWHSSEQASQLTTNTKDSIFLATILPDYFREIRLAKQSGKYASANKYLEKLIKFQQENASYALPSARKIKIEILYNKHNPFKTLFPYYLGLGTISLILLLSMIAIGKKVPQSIQYAFYYLLLLGFIAHTLGIAFRWYIAGHAPMSNGYETMVFISWITLLAGYLFNKKSTFILTATAILGGLTLLVANLSFMDPQITNLVPVLQSYWLTIHVSVITAGYGFLGLGAILGLLNLLLIILKTRTNSTSIMATYTELTIVNHKTLIVGLYLLTIGTFLGAVWANESWGRYWGWDPKETWAFISILVYTLVTHARIIPGMRGYFVFNALSLWGFSSILMTYFGVNYYLSGLHSYAGGDPVPVPAFVYYTIVILIAITVWASIKKDGSPSEPSDIQ